MNSFVIDFIYIFLTEYLAQFAKKIKKIKINTPVIESCKNTMLSAAIGCRRVMNKATMFGNSIKNNVSEPFSALHR